MKNKSICTCSSMKCGHRMSSPTKTNQNKIMRTMNLKFMNENNWDKWKSYVSDFYKNYQVRNVQVSPLFIKQPVDNKPYLEINIFGHNFTTLLDSVVLGTKLYLY